MAGMLILAELQETPHAVDEIGHVLVGEGIAKRQHRHRMRHLRKRPDGTAPTFCDGESRVTSPGNRASMASLRQPLPSRGKKN
jgi:hypothetical protein